MRLRACACVCLIVDITDLKIHTYLHIVILFHNGIKIKISIKTYKVFQKKLFFPPHSHSSFPLACKTVSTPRDMYTVSVELLHIGRLPSDNQLKPVVESRPGGKRNYIEYFQKKYTIFLEHPVHDGHTYYM